MTTMEEIATKITAEGLTLDGADALGAIDRLVFQYERLFGRASREACREAVAGLLAELAPSDIPTSLRAA
jgi:hypothetical protein